MVLSDTMKQMMRYFLLLLLHVGCTTPNPAVVFQTDFGLKDGAVSAMKGVALGVDPSLRLSDLTHEIPAYNIWEAAYRLDQTIDYWPRGTVFVSVVDPGVGTERKSVVLATQSGHYVVTPDNGTLTLAAHRLGIAGLREIDETTNRLPGSRSSHTFHGRDVYAYTAARLASGQISFDEVGPALPSQVVSIPHQKPRSADGVVWGTIPVLDPQYGNVWTNIDRETFKAMRIQVGQLLSLTIHNGERQVFAGHIPFVRTFGDVPEGKPLAYFNSQNRLSFAINMGDFARAHKVRSGAKWRVRLTR